MPSLWSRLVRRKHRISSRKQEREDAIYSGDHSVFIQKLEVRKTNWTTAQNEREHMVSNERRPPSVSGELKIHDTASNERVGRFQNPGNCDWKSGMPARVTEQGDLSSTKVEKENTREVSDSDNAQNRIPIAKDCGNSGDQHNHAAAQKDTYVEYIQSRPETSNSAISAWQRYSVPVFSTQKPADDRVHRESGVKDNKSNYVPKAVKMLDFTQILTGQFPGDQQFSEPDLRLISERTLVSSPGEFFKIIPTFESRHEYGPRHSREQGIGILNRISEIIPAELCPDFQGHNQTTSTGFNSHIYVERSQLNESSIPITAVSVLHNNIDFCPPASAAGSGGRSNTCYSQLAEYEGMDQIGANTKHSHIMSENSDYNNDMAANTEYSHNRAAKSDDDHDMMTASIDYSHQGGVRPLVSREQRPVSMTSATGHRDPVTDPRDDQVTDADIDRVLAQLDLVTGDEQDIFDQFLEGVFNQKEEVLY